MSAARPNDQLADVMAHAGMSRKALARAVRDASARDGHPISCDHTAVGRWLAGTHPRRRTAEYIADVLGARLSRAVKPADLGFPDSDGYSENFGADYGDEIDVAAAVLGGLLRGDRDQARPIVDASPIPAAWSQASLSWLVRTGPGDLPERPAGVRVGVRDIDRLQATVAAFADMDDRFGGGHARQALVQYLGSDLPSLLSGRYDEGVGRRLYAAAAESVLLAAWMTYDVGAHGLAQRYFVQALRLAQAADDTLLAGSVLDAMSHQATFLGRTREAATLARAARQGTSASASPTLTAHFHAMEARALAAGGDGVGAERALSEAVRVFERRRPGDDPKFFTYFDDAELAAEFSHCFRDTGRFADAVTYSGRAMTGSVRSDFFVTMVRASGHLGAGEVDQACVVAAEALDLGAGLRSSRCVEYVRLFRRQIGARDSVGAVADLQEQAAGHPLWAASTPVAS